MSYLRARKSDLAAVYEDPLHFRGSVHGRCRKNNQVRVLADFDASDTIGHSEGLCRVQRNRAERAVGGEPVGDGQFGIFAEETRGKSCA